jgi:cob(I)alamin adenosyltransferase
MSQVTTKGGDDGTTSALSGERLPKSHLIMECVGAVDELRAQTALVRLHIIDGRPEHFERISEFLRWLLHVYFLIGSECSDPVQKHPEYHLRSVGDREVERLEAEQQWLEEITPLPNTFIVSASNLMAAHVDVATVAARRLERAVVRLRESVPELDSPNLFIFLNRLNDYLYMLARELERPAHETIKYEELDK